MSALLKLKLNKEKEKTADKKRIKATGENKYFYKVSNHQELFKIGKSFYHDFEYGIKSFAIGSTGYRTTQQKTILGLASYFDHVADHKIIIISDNLSQGVFKEIIFASKPIYFEIEDLKIDMYSFYEHFDYINLDAIIANVDEKGDKICTNIYDKIEEKYDVIFWDVPELFKIQQQFKHYFTMIMRFESLSIIVAPGVTKVKAVKNIQSFFDSYGINLKGVLFDAGRKIED